MAERTAMVQEVQFPILYFKLNGGFWGVTKDELIPSIDGVSSYRERKMHLRRVLVFREIV